MNAPTLNFAIEKLNGARMALIKACRAMNLAEATHGIGSAEANAIENGPMTEAQKNSVTGPAATVRVAILLVTHWLPMIDEGYAEDQA